MDRRLRTLRLIISMETLKVETALPTGHAPFPGVWPENSLGWAGSGVLMCHGGVSLRAWGGA